MTDPSQFPPPTGPVDPYAPPPLTRGAPGYPPSYPFPPGPYGGAYLPPAHLRPKPRVWTVFVAFVLALGPGCFAGVAVAVVATMIIHGPDAFQVDAGAAGSDSSSDSTSGGPPDTDARAAAIVREPAIFLPMMLTMQVVLAGVALSGGFLSPTPLTRRLRLGRPALPWYGYPVVAVGTLAFGVTSGIVIELLGLGDEGVLEELERAIAGMRGLTLVFAALVIGVAPAFGEELLLRGYIQTRLAQRWPRLVALAVASLLFGVMHMDPVQGTMAVGMGLYLGEVADRTGSIWPAVVGHAFNNAVATVIGALGTSEGDASVSWKALLVTVPVFALCVAYVLRRPVVAVEPDAAPALQPMPPYPPAPYYMPPGTA